MIEAQFYLHYFMGVELHLFPGSSSDKWEENLAHVYL